MAILTVATATVFQVAETSAQSQSDRHTSIATSLFLEEPSFGHLDTTEEDQGGPRGLQPGISIRIARDLTSRVGVGLLIDFAASHTWRGEYLFYGESLSESARLPRVQSFRFNTFTPVLMYRVGSTKRWEFAVDGGLTFAYIKYGDVSFRPRESLSPVDTNVAYTSGLATGLSAKLRTARRLTWVADLQVTSVKFSEIQGLVIRPGGGVQLEF